MRATVVATGTSRLRCHTCSTKARTTEAASTVVKASRPCRCCSEAWSSRGAAGLTSSVPHSS
jgi:hypothetical protein